MYIVQFTAIFSPSTRPAVNASGTLNGNGNELTCCKGVVLGSSRVFNRVFVKRNSYLQPCCHQMKVSKGPPLPIRSPLRRSRAQASSLVGSLSTYIAHFSTRHTTSFPTRFFACVTAHDCIPT